MARKRKCPLKRLSMYMPEEMHKTLEEIAEKRQTTITKLVLQAVLQRITWEKRYE